MTKLEQLEELIDSIPAPTLLEVKPDMIYSLTISDVRPWLISWEEDGEETALHFIFAPSKQGKSHFSKPDTERDSRRNE